MADGIVQPSAAIKAMEREYKSKADDTATMFEKLLKLLAEKDAELDNLKYDLQDQTESRRHWHKRAVDAEGRFTNVQHLLILIDGNQTFFKPHLIQSGVKEAVQTLIAEAKALALAQHKNDLPEHLSVIAHIFIDVGKLADDLSTAGVLPEPDQLWTFIQDASKLEPGVTISDCGADHKAVDAKMKHFYELYLENLHCRHLFLALGRQSEYYNVLSNFADDTFTKQKTSLIKPGQGLPEKYNLPFDTVEFSTLESVRQQTVSFDKEIPKVNGQAPLADRAPNPSIPKYDGMPPTAPRGLNPAAPKFDTSPANAPRAVGSVDESIPKTNGTLGTPRIERPALSAAPNGAPPVIRKQSSSVGQAAPNGAPPVTPEQSSSVGQAAPVPIIAQNHPIPLRNNNSDPLEDSSSARVVKLDTSSHSSHQSNNAEQGWESAETNSYAPDPIAVPWGEEITPAPEQVDGPSYTRRNNNYNNGRRQGGGGGGGGGKQDRSLGASGKRFPKQFEGSWDEMVSQGSSTPPQPKSVSMSSSATSKSTDFTNAFTRQVVAKPEPNPQARPVLAPIALNRKYERIDLKLPRPAPDDEAAFKLRTQNRHLCNEQQMRGKCSDIKCTFDHEEISDGVYLALRTKARYSPCNQGSRCRRHDCYLAHHCPNVSRLSACGRVNCPFRMRGLHDIVDLDIVEMIEPSKQPEAKSLGGQEAPIEGLL